MMAAVASGRRTKIICTLGPASGEAGVLGAMIEAGMDIARLNFSHGTCAEHAARLAALRQAQHDTGRDVALLFDLRGPEVRLLLPGGEPVPVQAGTEISLPESTWPGLREAIRPGQQVLLADGAIVAEVVPALPEAGPGAVPRLRFLSSGILRDRSKLALPGMRPDLPALSERDIQDVRFGVAMGADFFAMSYVEEARELLELRDLLQSMGSGAATVAKIETRQGLHSLGAIAAVADGVMVARGDLGVECPYDEIPLIQKQILALCNRIGKPGITATEMLESMVRSPRPTRAEASDVFNAVLDGTDALMLSAETAIGAYPVEAVAAMAKIARRAEAGAAGAALGLRSAAAGRLGVVQPGDAPPGAVLHGTMPPAAAIAEAAVGAAVAVSADAIVTPTRSGYTARMVSRLRPACPVIAVTPDPQTARILKMSWGVTPLVDPVATAGGGEPGAVSGTYLVESALEAALSSGQIAQGDLVVVTSGVPAGVPGTTNMLQLRTIGTMLARGTGIVAAAAATAGRSVVTGLLCVVREAAELEARFSEGGILAVPATGAEFVPYMARASAVLTAEAGLSSHAAVCGLSLGVPVVVGVAGLSALPHGQLVTVDAQRGIVYLGKVRPV
ncbi:MAG: pyruvate kinase [Bacillota bacterium]|nr:pyruvate kinase [Bacillota bacterium]